jgi:hypothetical protein
LSRNNSFLFRQKTKLVTRSSRNSIKQVKEC